MTGTRSVTLNSNFFIAGITGTVAWETLDPISGENFISFSFNGPLTYSGTQMATGFPSSSSIDWTGTTMQDETLLAFQAFEAVIGVDFVRIADDAGR